MKALAKTLQNTKLFVLMALWLLAYGTAQLWPASFWFEVHSVNAGPARVGESVPMLVDRATHRSFDGSWVATVKTWEETGAVGSGWVVYCTATGSAKYAPDSKLPRGLTLKWWTDGKCPSLDAGRYVITTTWTIQPTLAILPAKRVSADSNIFEVLP